MKKTRVVEWRTAYPNSIAAKLAEAGYYRDLAWQARGQGYARDVKPDAWPVFKSNIEKATQLLDAMGPEARVEPQWYADRLQISVERSEPRATFEKLLAEALKRHPTYLPIYFEGARAYAPNWGGSHKALNEFIDAAVARTKDRLGDTLYVRLHWGNSTTSMFENGQANWTRFQAGMQKLIADYPDPWNVNAYGKFACMAREGDAMVDAFDRIGGNVTLDAWGGMNFYLGCKQAADQVAQLSGARPKKKVP